MELFSFLTKALLKRAVDVNTGWRKKKDHFVWCRQITEKSATHRYLWVSRGHELHPHSHIHTQAKGLPVYSLLSLGMRKSDPQITCLQRWWYVILCRAVTPFWNILHCSAFDKIAIRFGKFQDNLYCRPTYFPFSIFIGRMPKINKAQDNWIFR